jgi:hypothetical protein
MKHVFLIAVILLGATNATGQGPTIGALCDGVVAASSQDFWEKWEAADCVVYAQPVWVLGCLQPDMVMGVGSYDGPVPGECTFVLTVTEVWKGAGVFDGGGVGTSWLNNVVFQVGPPPGLVTWSPENCTLVVEENTDQVFFLRELDGQWMSYQCFGSNIYDRSWLEAEVGSPLPADTMTWGQMKAIYK